MVASVPGRQSAQPAQLTRRLDLGGCSRRVFGRVARFEEYVGGSPGRAAPEESQEEHTLPPKFKVEGAFLGTKFVTLCFQRATPQNSQPK